MVCMVVIDGVVNVHGLIVLVDVFGLEIEIEIEIEIGLRLRLRLD